MEEQGPSVGKPPTATTNEEEEFFLFVGAATEIPEIRWPPLTENDNKKREAANG